MMKKLLLKIKKLIWKRKFLIDYFYDILMNTEYIRDGVCIAFIVNELLSIVENAGLMGIPIPKIITNAIDILKSKSGDENA